MLQGAEMKRIERTRVEAFAAEFPFLDKILDMGRITVAQVARVDAELLRSVINAEPTWIRWMLWNTSRNEQMLLLDRDGKILGKVGYRLHEGKLVRRAWMESVQDCLAFMAPVQRNKVFYLLHHEVCFIASAERITLHKLPKAASSVDAWIEQQAAARRAELQAECAKIDAEAGSPAAK
jgi:hypothetical protein